MKSAKEVGQSLVEKFNSGQFEAIYAELYSPDVESIEADGQTAQGMAGIQAKNEWWEKEFEVHSTKATGPFPHQDSLFCVIFEMDITHRASGQRSQSQEVAVYTVKDGRIVREQFCYQE